MKIEIYQDTWNDLWNWRCIATNGVLMAFSGYTYARKRDAVRAARRTRYLMILDGPIVETEE